jgi:hypothetical protein
MLRANSRLLCFAAAIVSAALSGIRGNAGAAQQSASVQTQPQFPVRANGSRLVDANGVPFPILGRVCWMISYLSPAQYLAVMDDSVAKGFTAIEVKPPLAPQGYQFDSNGNLPFLKRVDGGNWAGQVIPYGNVNTEAPDFTTPNEAFWQGVDAFFASAEQKGLLVLWFPAYVGYDNTDWWMEMMVANGTTRMRAYGAWVANRYKNQKNLVWMLGGDKGTGAIPFNSSELAVETAFVQGLKSVATDSREYSAEWLRRSIAKDLFPSDITLNGTYASATEIILQGQRAWAYSPQVPAFAQEYPFEDLQGTGNVRPLTMYAWLSTIGGYLFGNGVFTDFTPPIYLNYMNTEGTRHARRLNEFIRTIPWQSLVPNTTAVTAGRGSTIDLSYVASAVSNDGSLFLAYVPPQHTGPITIDMSVMGGTTSTRWWDPMSGVYTTDVTGLPNAGSHVFTPPGTNSVGQTDWMLVLSSNRLALVPPSNLRIVPSSH